MEAKMQTATIPEQQRGTPVQVRLHQKLPQAIENWRRGQESIPSRPEAIRRLLQRSLATPPPPAQS
jgi:hypothetical protein